MARRRVAQPGGLVGRAVARHDGRRCVAWRGAWRRWTGMSKGGPARERHAVLSGEGHAAPARCDPWAELVDLVTRAGGRRAARRMSRFGEPQPDGHFGGTFDPIHYGHLRTAFELLEAAGTSPRCASCRPATRRTGTRTHADAAMRVAMVRAAIDGEPRFILDDRELRREGPSYSVDTLLDLRAEYRIARCA
jgi:hypothetical protein